MASPKDINGVGIGVVVRKGVETGCEHGGAVSGPGPSGTHIGNGLAETARAGHNLEASGNAHAGFPPPETAFQIVGTGWHSRYITGTPSTVGIRGTPQERAVDLDIVDYHTSTLQADSLSLVPWLHCRVSAAPSSGPHRRTSTCKAWHALQGVLDQDQSPLNFVPGGKPTQAKPN